MQLQRSFAAVQQLESGYASSLHTKRHGGSTFQLASSSVSLKSDRSGVLDAGQLCHCALQLDDVHGLVL